MCDHTIVHQRPCLVVYINHQEYFEIRVINLNTNTIECVTTFKVNDKTMMTKIHVDQLVKNTQGVSMKCSLAETSVNGGRVIVSQVDIREESINIRELCDLFRAYQDNVGDRKIDFEKIKQNLELEANFGQNF